MDYFEESREKAAWVSSVAVGSSCIVGPITGAFLNRFGLRISATFGCLLCSAALALGSFAPNIIILYIAFSAPFGLGLSLVYVTSTVIVTHYFTKRRSLALGLVIAGQGLGTMILGPTLQALVDVLDWRTTFRVFAGIVAVTSLTGCFLHQGASPSDDHEKARPKKFRFNLSLLKNRTVLILLATIPAYSTSRMVPYVHLIKHCDDLGIPADKSSTLYLFIGISAALGRLGGGFLCDLRYIKTLRLFQAATFIMGASTMLLTLANTYPALVVYVIIFSMADGMMVSTFFVECLEIVEEWQRASIVGFNSLVGAPFLLCSPPLAGLMADKLGNYFAAFLMAGGFGVIASIIPFFLLCVKREPEQLVDHDIELKLDEVQGEDIDIDEEEPKPRSFSRISAIINRTDRQRSTSFITAMESPLY
ncbi:hypothetical protein ACROYT_G041636 [Oculina patagonica]